MRILDGYIGRAVLGGTLLVMCVLLSLFVFIELVSELDVIGKGQYGTWEAFQYVALSVPRLTYELMPLAALLGSLIGLGLLASNNELVVMRAAGVSLNRMTWGALKAGLLLVIVAVLMGELVAAESEQRAQDVRSTALSGQTSLRTDEGFWTRDGSNFINVRGVFPGGRLTGVYIYEFDEAQRLQRVSSAKSATYDEGQWLLETVRRSEITGDGVRTERLPHMTWHSRLSLELLDIIAIQPDSLSSAGLYKYIRYLEDNGLSAARYQMEFWTRIVLPFATCVMVFVALPFVFGPLRSVGAGQRILVGVLAGLGFYVFNQIVSYVGLIYQFNPAASAAAPTVLFLGVAVYMMRKVY